MKRVPRSEQTREAFRSLFEEGSGDDPKSDLVKLAVRLIVEEALEGEVRDRLQRGYYERGEQMVGHRNGYREGHLNTSEGEVRFAEPQVRDVPGGFRSAVREHVSGRTEGLEHFAVEMYARGLSTRDIEDAFHDEDGRSLLSRTAVSEVTEVPWKEYEDFATRDLEPSTCSSMASQRA